MNQTNDEEGQDVCCPYCQSPDSCEHLLLAVDRTFRQAEGGLLYEGFNARWDKILGEADDPNFEEREPFEELLQEVDSLADFEASASHDGGPGRSSNYSFFYCSSKMKALLAEKTFNAAP